LLWGNDNETLMRQTRSNLLDVCAKVHSDHLLSKELGC